MTPQEKEHVEAFRRDVVEPSKTKLVMIDFWAEWCGPCKALSPVLEKVAADYAEKGVVLAKVDTDKNPFISAQFQIKSIPTVYAMFQGQLVADLTSARTESQLKAMLDKILSQIPVESAEAAQEAEIEPLIAMGEQILSDGDAARALSIFDQVAEIAPMHPEIVSGRVRALIALGDLDQAEATLSAIPEEIASSEIDRARAALDLARAAPATEDLSPLIAAAAADPENLQARFDLANGQMAAGNRDEAADLLLAIVAKDRDWNDGAARIQFLKLLEVVGLEDPWVSGQRRRLSAILFT